MGDDVDDDDLLSESPATGKMEKMSLLPCADSNLDESITTATARTNVALLICRIMVRLINDVERGLSHE